MTTVVCNFEEMACDSEAQGGSRSSVQKVWRLDDSLVGVAGTYAYCVQFINWLASDAPIEAAPDMEDVKAMVLVRHGRGARIWYYDSSPTPYPVKDRFGAIGTGEGPALAAMYLGCSPKEAVKVAAKVDPHTGGRVLTYSLRPAAS